MDDNNPDAAAVIGGLLGAVEVMRIALRTQDPASNQALDQIVAEARAWMKAHGATSEQVAAIDVHLAAARGLQGVYANL